MEGGIWSRWRVQRLCHVWSWGLRYEKEPGSGPLVGWRSWGHIVRQRDYRGQRWKRDGTLKRVVDGKQWSKRRLAMYEGKQIMKGIVFQFKMYKIQTHTLSFEGFLKKKLNDWMSIREDLGPEWEEANPVSVLVGGASRWPGWKVSAHLYMDMSERMCHCWPCIPGRYFWVVVEAFHCYPFKTRSKK